MHVARRILACLLGKGNEHFAKMDPIKVCRLTDLPTKHTTHRKTARVGILVADKDCICIV